MKKIPFFSLLLCFVCLTAPAWAVDTDGDGYDDTVDAFPSDRAAAVDTDHDGQPNDYLFTLLNSFESGSLGSGWSASTNPAGAPTAWQVNTSAGASQGSKAAVSNMAIAGPNASSYANHVTNTLSLALTVTGTVQVRYDYKFSSTSNGLPLYTFKLPCDSCLYGEATVTSSWITETRTLAAGTHQLQWVHDCVATETTRSGGPCTTLYGSSTAAIDNVRISPATTLVTDNDDDNDGVADASDALPLNAAESADTDSDGIGNNADTDDDNDGVTDGSDNCPTIVNNSQLNTDGDSQGNVCDSDDDNDSVTDASDKFPLNAAASADTDSDGFPDSWNAACDAACQAASGLALDICPNTASSNQLNTDGDSQGDACDNDDDNDGVADASDKFPLNPAEWADSDNDGIGDNAETDDDNDSVLDGSDNCPTKANSTQLNTDGDSQGDACDSDDDNDGVADSSDKFPLNAAASADTDSDGVPDSWNAACDAGCQAASGLVLDNCPSLVNSNQQNTDGDAQGDVCDSDDDNDGVADTPDSFPFDASRSEGNNNILYTFSGDNASDYFGDAVSGAGDVNGDGYADVIVGTDGDDNNGSNSGSARVFSGATGAILYTFNGDSAGDSFGGSVSGAGDVNSDGYADVIVGAYQDDNTGSSSGSARVFSGATGAILYTFNGDGAGDNFGGSVSAAGDVNGDGFSDVIVGASGDDNNGANSGSARVFSGATGAVLYTFNGDSADDRFGGSVSGAGDVNGDGYADVIVGAHYDDNNGSDSGSAKVFSGANGAVLYTFNGNNVSGYFGHSVSSAGDVNGDGYADVVGAYKNIRTALVFSGATGAVLYTFNGDDTNILFDSVSGADDVNGDGFADVIVGAGRDDNNGYDSGSARVFSGATGAILYTFDGDSAGDYFGYSVSGAGDVNGDGFADLIVGAYGDDNNGTNSGSARVFSGKGLWTDTDGDGLNDAVDTDDDNDGAMDISDLFPLDTDNDGIGNNADLDDDNDSVPDYIDADPLNAANASERSLLLNAPYSGSGVLEGQTAQ